MQKLLNYYPIYRLYFGEVETPCTAYNFRAVCSVDEHATVSPIVWLREVAFRYVHSIASPSATSNKCDFDLQLSPVHSHIKMHVENLFKTIQNNIKHTNIYS